jgi:hypothetical protein
LRTVRRGICIRAGLQAADGDDLVPQLDSDGEGAGSPAKDGIGAVVRALERGDNVTLVQPYKGGTEEDGRQLLMQQVTRIMFAKREKKQEHPMFLRIFLKILLTENSSPCKTSFAKQSEFQKLPQLGKD